MDFRNNEQLCKRTAGFLTKQPNQVGVQVKLKTNRCSTIHGFVTSVHFPFFNKIDIFHPFSGLFTALYFYRWHFHQYDVNTVDLFC